MDYLITQNIGFIGAGHLTKSMVFGLIQSGFPTSQIWIANRSFQKLEFFKTQGIHTTTDNGELIFNADTLVLSVRPADAASLLKQIKPKITTSHLLISVMAGLDSKKIIDENTNQPLIRAMPNTPSAIQQAMTGLWANEFVTLNQKKITSELFEAMGQILWLDNENLMHSLTAISGCGPAYFLLFFKAMIDCAKKLGLSEQDAKKIVLQTSKGATKMAEILPNEIDDLINQIAVPGGVTEKAILEFKNQNLELVVEKAIQSAFNKSNNI